MPDYGSIHNCHYPIDWAYIIDIVRAGAWRIPVRPNVPDQRPPSGETAMPSSFTDVRSSLVLGRHFAECAVSLVPGIL